MKSAQLYTLTATLLLLLFTTPSLAQTDQILNERILYKIVDPQTEQVAMHWKDQNDSIIGNLGNLAKVFSENNQELLFAMNGGMFHPDYSPVGLYIEHGKELAKINKSSGSSNFNLQPNGVFALYKDGNGLICTTATFAVDPQMQFATQSGPMLLIDGDFHPAFNKGSSNLNIRNGVGILPDGRMVFAMSKSYINFYDFALFFKNLGCKNALYLDGAVSQVYFPKEDWVQTNRKFGVMMSVSAKED